MDELAPKATLPAGQCGTPPATKCCNSPVDSVRRATCLVQCGVIKVKQNVADGRIAVQGRYGHEVRDS